LPRNRENRPVGDERDVRTRQIALLALSDAELEQLGLAFDSPIRKVVRR